MLSLETPKPSSRRRVEVSGEHGRQKYRNRIQITANMLEIAKGGSRKTRIMYLGNLSFDLLQKYLTLLLRSGLIEVEKNNDRMYVTTEKGRRFLEDFHKAKDYSQKAERRRRALEESLSGA